MARKKTRRVWTTEDNRTLKTLARKRNEDKRNRATTETDSRSHVSASFQLGVSFR